MSMTSTTAVVWLRRDLRLDDNPALTAAIARCDRVIPVYIDDRDSQSQWRQGAASDWWLHHSLDALGRDIQRCGGRLILRQGNALELLQSLVLETGACEVHWNRLYEPWTRERDTTVKKTLEAQGVEVVSHNGSLLNEPWTVLTKTETPYKVFTPYWRAARHAMQPPTPLDPVERIPGPKAAVESLELDALQLLPTIRWDRGIEAAWSPGESHALKRARTFVIDDVTHYDDARNLPGKSGVSRLSPYLHFGELSVRRLWQIVESNSPHSDGREIYLTELGWREFSHYALYHFPATTDAPMNPKFAHFEWREDDTMLRAWRKGITGIPIVDAGMRELWHTGWMHNRVRMIVASFLVKNIRMHWLHGARWFWDTLVDADLPANTLGWQWSAGCGVDAAPYFRIFNPVSQGERFDAQGDYVRRWVPELARVPNKFIHCPWKLPDAKAKEIGFRPGSDYPNPIVDLKTTRESALAAFKALKEVA
ncbi:MAG: deoxyribodipyrimidine photo-lyase [Pseudomonadota bacterium]